MSFVGDLLVALARGIDNTMVIHTIHLQGQGCNSQHSPSSIAVRKTKIGSTLLLMPITPYPIHVWWMDILLDTHGQCSLHNQCSKCIVLCKAALLDGKMHIIGHIIAFSFGVLGKIRITKVDVSLHIKRTRVLTNLHTNRRVCISLIILEGTKPSHEIQLTQI